jgi:hypothetical protein
MVNFLAIIISTVLSLIVLFPTSSTYSIERCSNMQTSIKIIDESGGKRLSGTTLDTLENSPFKSYVTNVSKHVITKIEETSQCSGSANSHPTVELLFVYRPLVTPATAPFDFNHSKSNGTRSLDSPWVKLTKSSSPNLSVRAAFVWSERQFLFDQALMAGSRASPTNLLPIDERVFGKYVQDYTNSVLLAASPEARSSAQENITKRLPSEILWLFRHAWQSTLAPFSTEVDHARTTTIQRVEVGYVSLTNALVDQFLGSSTVEIRYASILDLKKAFNIDKYRVNQLH